jgi:glycosyltransferase involved in cell wall biosynthesis
MKILHLLSNWKWTERSELVVDLALAQARLGEQVWLVCGQAPPESDPGTDVLFHARGKGLEHIAAWPEMTKHTRFTLLSRARGRIREMMDRVKPDVIHCHMRNAHLTAGLGCGKNSGALLIRTAYDPDRLGGDLRSQWCYRHFTRGLIVVTEKARQSAISRSFPPERVKVIPPGIDLERFSPARGLAGRTDFGLPQGGFVAGVVSRIRPERRLDIPLGALQLLRESCPGLRLLLVGRGRPGAVERVVEKPAADLGVTDRVALAGYCGGDDLVAAFRQMQVLLYPMPGTDRTCRTVREAMAAGVPVIAADMGYLPELVRDGRTGYLVKQSAEGFAGALKRLINAPDLSRQLSRQALASARERFDWKTLAAQTLKFYERVGSVQPSAEGRG